MTALVDYDRLDREARRLAPDYRAAHPFPHAVLRDAFPADRLRGIAEAAQAVVDAGDAGVKEHAYARKGTVGHNRTWTGDTRALFHELNSAPFVRFLETLTGIEGLIPDPHYLGGGLHMIPPGGWLDVHADFSRHDKLDLDRRLNVILYLNDDWDPAWGGALELWSRDMARKVVEVVPDLGTMVVFDTIEDGYHGHPDPLACPPDRSRLSMATYYYTAGLGDGARRADTPTDWRQRRDGKLRSWRDFVPPIVIDGGRRLVRARRGRGGI